MLVISSIFLVIYIIKITAEYFAGSIGWPVALIGIGFLTIIIAVITFHADKRFKRSRYTS